MKKEITYKHTHQRWLEEEENVRANRIDNIIVAIRANHGYDLFKCAFNPFHYT